MRLNQALLQLSYLGCKKGGFATDVKLKRQLGTVEFALKHSVSLC